MPERSPLIRVTAISICAVTASIASVLPFLIVGGGDIGGAAIFLLGVAAILNFVIGFAVSLTAYSWMHRERKVSFRWALIAANFCGGVLALATYIFWGLTDFLYLGVPIILAANTWAICGWYLIARPQLRQAPNA